jgi:arsenite transporter
MIQQPNILRRLISNSGTTVLLICSIFIGSLLGWLRPEQGANLGCYVDPLILALLFLLFFEINLLALSRWKEHSRSLAITWCCNFIIIPTIGFLIASLFLSGQPLLHTGLVIYFMAPCTDWFLGFTRMAKGNAALGAVLIPLNLISQLLLYPVYLSLFAGEQVPSNISSISSSLITWCLQPFLAATIANLLLRWLLPTKRFEHILTTSNRIMPVVIAALIVCIFAANITTILDHVFAFALILAAVFIFFLITWFLAEAATKIFRLSYPDHALLTMSTAARNAPLMLGLTITAIPDQPLIYAAIIIGMLVEFPHLTALKHLLLRKQKDSNPISFSNRASENHQPETIAL